MDEFALVERRRKVARRVEVAGVDSSRLMWAVEMNVVIEVGWSVYGSFA